MWLLPLLAVGALIYLAKKDRAPRYVQFALPPPPMAPQPMMMVPMPVASAPTPMDVLCQHIQVGQQPPPIVIMCSIAQAESIGRPDIAGDIIRMFVVPVVLAHQQRMQQYAPPQQSAPSSPAASAPAPGPGASPSAPAPTQVAPPPAPTGQLTDAQIQAMLNADPARFLSRVQRGEVIDVAPGPEHQAPPAVAQQVATDPGGQDGTMIGGAVAEAMMPPAEEMPHAFLPSPIHGVEPQRWSAFCDRLVRESPEFASDRHIGQYRQNTDRLLELGIDPAALRGSPDRQRDALDRDLADAYHHAMSDGLARTYLHRRIRLPDREEAMAVTLSGVLGVIQAAGLEGAANWLSSAGDRKRFRHTTAAFLRSNGVF